MPSNQSWGISYMLVYWNVCMHMHLYIFENKPSHPVEYLLRFDVYIMGICWEKSIHTEIQEV